MQIIQTILEFLIFTVGLKIIIGHWIAERIYNWAKTSFSKTDRKDAIWKHYQLRAAGDGHQNDSVLTCGEGKCAVFS